LRQRRPFFGGWQPSRKLPAHARHRGNWPGAADARENVTIQREVRHTGRL
jgi:hypothetical protein